MRRMNTMKFLEKRTRRISQAVEPAEASEIIGGKFLSRASGDKFSATHGPG